MKVATDGNSNTEQLESRPQYEPDHSVSFISEGSERRLRTEERKKYKPTSLLCLNLNSCPASQTMKPEQHAVTRSPRSAGKNKLGSSVNDSDKVTRLSNKRVSSLHDVNTSQQPNMDSVVSPGRRPRKGAHSSSSSLFVDRDKSYTVMAVDISNHVNSSDCCNPHIP